VEGGKEGRKEGGREGGREGRKVGGKNRLFLPAQLPVGQFE
jgi:hypothetical protein